MFFRPQRRAIALFQGKKNGARTGQKLRIGDLYIGSQGGKIRHAAPQIPIQTID